MPDYTQLWSDLINQELSNNCYEERLLFLDAGIACPDAKSIGQKLARKQNSDRPLWGQKYPLLGQIPEIDESLPIAIHPDITEYCVCVGNFYEDELYCQWWGKNALVPVQMWSATKIISMLAVIIYASQCDPDSRYENWRIGEHPITTIYDRIVDYGDKQVMTSNSLAGLLKQFFEPGVITQFVHQLTGNPAGEFTGIHGEFPLVHRPYLIDQATGRTLLTYSPLTYQVGVGQNLISAYDLTRIMSLVGWHAHLPAPCRLPLANSHNLRLLIHALVKDTARYVDRVVTCPTVISKMGFGYSDQRQRMEITYTCFLQLDAQQSVCFSLRGYSAIMDRDLAACTVDATMAIAVQQVIDYVLGIDAGDKSK